MFKKLNFKTLIILFGGLLAVVVLLQLFKNKGSDRNFNSQFITVDTSKVTSIAITTKGSKEEIKVTRNGNNWTFTNKGKTLKTEKGLMEGMVAELANMKAERIAATEKEQWASLEVTDTASTRVKVFEGDKLTADFLVGKFSYQQNPQKFTTYIRLFDEDEVYAVNGFLAMTFNKGANELRDKTLVSINNPSDVTKVSFNYPDSSFVLSFENKTWLINNEKADSAKVIEYLNSVSRLTSYNFAEESVIPGKLVFGVTIEGKNFQPVSLKAFETNDTTIRYLVTSTINADAKFDGTKSDLMKQAFVGAKRFKPTATKDKK